MPIYDYDAAAPNPQDWESIENWGDPNVDSDWETYAAQDYAQEGVDAADGEDVEEDVEGIRAHILGAASVQDLDVVEQESLESESRLEWEWGGDLNLLDPDIQWHDEEHHAEHHAEQLRLRRPPVGINASKQEVRWPTATEVQSLLFPISRYSRKDAENWAIDHDFPVIRVVQTATGAYHRVRVHEPAEYMSGRMRTITLSTRLGIKAIVGVPLRSSGRQHLKRQPYSPQREQTQRVQQEHLRLPCPNGRRTIPVGGDLDKTHDQSELLAAGTLAYQMAFPKIAMLVGSHGYPLGASIACGERGCAYAVIDNPEIVVKITSDPTEISAIRVLAKVPTDVRNFELAAVARFTCTFGVLDWWGVVMPRLYPLDPEGFKWLGDYGYKMGALIAHLKDAHEWSAHDLYENLVHKRRTISAPQNPRMVRQIIRVIQALLTMNVIGLRWSDLTEGNVLQDAKGQWKIIDLGRSRWKSSQVYAPQIAAEY